MTNRFSTLFPAWDLFDQLTQLASESAGSGVHTSPAGAHDMWHDEESAYLNVDLPGVALEDVDLSVDGDALTVQVSRTIAEPETAEGDEWRWARRERHDFSAERTYRLPFDIEAAGIEAELSHGVLSVRLPRAEATKPLRINVTARS